ncbi:MAG: putative lipopolysaccharide heptosyltransferase III [candidate division NC10 bacterium]|nr:putative lipopolysaccharide heptosyltransferase III [candidate division NC10 bacterium]
MACRVSMIEAPGRILAITLKHLGDVLLATPALHALKTAFPGSKITALVRGGAEEMLTFNPDLEEILTFGKGRGLLAKLLSEWRLVRQVRRTRPDLVVEMGKGDREAILGVLSGAKVRVGYDPQGSGLLARRCLLTHAVGQDWRKHVVESSLDLVRAMGVEPRDKRLRLFVPSTYGEAVEELLRSHGVSASDLLVTIHPTARWFFKCWTDEGFAQVADHLVALHGAKVAVTSGQAGREVEKAKRVIALARSPLIDLAGRLTLKHLAALIARSGVFVGVDSAPMHVAAAVSTPVVALFGPSREQNWRPWGDGHLVLQKDALCRSLARKTCEVTKRCECLEALTVEEVIAAVNQQLARRSRDRDPSSCSTTAR